VELPGKLVLTKEVWRLYDPPVFTVTGTLTSPFLHSSFHFSFVQRNVSMAITISPNWVCLLLPFF
ncbi:hypothetical protein ACRXB2_004150, partial [Yersinia enterocolitica]